MVNTSYTMPAEHLILYMIEMYPQRDKAEHKLLQFLTSLKYYTPIWARAKNFASFCGFLIDETPLSTKQSADKKIDEASELRSSK